MLVWSLYVFVCSVLCACVVMGVGFAVYAEIRGWPRGRGGKKKRGAEHVGKCVCASASTCLRQCVCESESARERKSKREEVETYSHVLSIKF